MTKIQSIILISIIVVAAVGGVVAYVLLDSQDQSSETIKIGVCADLDDTGGKSILQGAKLAAEQVNAEGGVLGRNFEIVAQDDDSGIQPVDTNAASGAFIRLITIDEADFIISTYLGLTYRELAFQHKKILFTVFESTRALTQGVLDDYDRYKYYFRTGIGNATAGAKGIADSIIVCGNLTGFNKIAFIYWHKMEPLVSLIIDELDGNGFDVVADEPITDILEASSAFTRAETAEAEILFPFIFGSTGINFIKEYYDRQSPMVIWGDVVLASMNDFWQVTEGKCEYITNKGYPVVAGYPLTSKTVPTRDAYMEGWSEEISNNAAAAYDTVRFILPDAIRRVGTIDIEAVIEALEETDVETSLCRRFVFTRSHDIMVGTEGPNKLSEDYFFEAMFQWQDGKQVPIYPKELMQEAGATYQFPDWPGPWDDLNP